MIDCLLWQIYALRAPSSLFMMFDILLQTSYDVEL